MNKFSLKPKIIFDQNPLTYLKTLSENNFFIIADPFVAKGDMIKKITDEIDGRDYVVFSDIVPDPPLETIALGIKRLNEEKPDCVIAIGGGSAIDTAKAVLFCSNIKKPKFIAIPTTSGTGSEVTSFSVITDREKGIKYPLVSDEMIPDVAILDTELVKSVPKSIVADTGMDVLTHAIESYVSLSANEFSDAFAEKAIKLVNKYLVRSFSDSSDIKAKEMMHKASLMAGIAFNSASLGINHAIAHNIGGKLHIPHGKINAMLLNLVIEFNSGIFGYSSDEYNVCAEKYAEISKLMGIEGNNTKILVRGLVRKIEKLKKDLSIPSRLSELDIKKENIPFDEIAEGALKDSCINTNPIKATKKDIISILNRLC